MNAPRCTEFDDIDFLAATPRTCSCTEAARVQPESPKAPAHDSFTRLLHRLEPDAETLRAEAETLVERGRGVLVIDDSTPAKLYARKVDLVTRHGSGKFREVIPGINLITLLWTDGDRKIPVDYRIYSKADGKTKNDHFRVVTPDDRISRTLDEFAIGAAGVVVHLRGYGLIRVSRNDDPDGVARYWASNDLGLEAGMRQYYA